MLQLIFVICPYSQINPLIGSARSDYGCELYVLSGAVTYVSIPRSQPVLWTEVPEINPTDDKLLRAY